MADTRFRQLRRTTTALVTVTTAKRERTSRGTRIQRIRQGFEGLDNTLPTNGVSPVPGSGTREGKTKFEETKGF